MMNLISGTGMPLPYSSHVLRFTFYKSQLEMSDFFLNIILNFIPKRGFNATVS